MQLRYQLPSVLTDGSCNYLYVKDFSPKYLVKKTKINCWAEALYLYSSAFRWLKPTVIKFFLSLLLKFKINNVQDKYMRGALSQ